MAIRWCHFRITDELLEQAKAAAADDRRSLSNWLAITVEKALAAEKQDTS